MSMGYVYILTNPSFREDWVKIGKTRRPVNVRSAELDNTAVPLPFEVYATIKTEQYEKVEKLIHKTIDRLTKLRIRQNREFFNIRPAEAYAILKDIAAVIPDAELEVFDEALKEKETDEDGTPVTKERRPPFRFSMIGIQVGEEVTFDPTGIRVRVAADNRIEYGDKLYTLSGFCCDFLPEKMRVASDAYQGPCYFSYNGETLDHLRTSKEKLARSV